MTKSVLGVIGGSGIYDLPGLENVREEEIASPWGEPSAPLRRGEIAGQHILYPNPVGKIKKTSEVAMTSEVFVSPLSVWQYCSDQNNSSNAFAKV